MVEVKAVPELLGRKVDRDRFKVEPLPELRGVDLINSLVSSGILDAAQGEQIARIFSETDFEEIKRLVFTDLTKALSIANSPSKLNSLREIARAMTENFATLQLLRVPELADDGLSFKPENTDQLELENLYALFLFSIVEPAIAELEEKFEPRTEKIAPPPAEKKPDLAQSEQAIAGAETKLGELDTERQKLLTEIKSCDPYDPDTNKLADIQTKQTALEVKLTSADLDKDVATVGRSKSFLERKLNTASTQGEYDQIEGLIVRIDKYTGAVAVFRNNMTALGDEIWGRRVLLDIPEVADLDNLYHPDSKNRSKLRYFADATAPEVVGLTNPHQRPLAQCLVFHRGLENAIKAVEQKIAAIDESKKRFVETTFIAPAREHLQEVEEKGIKRAWDRDHKQAFPELDEGVPGSFANLLAQAESFAPGGFVGKSSSDLDTLVSDLTTAETAINTELSNYLTSIGVPGESGTWSAVWGEYERRFLQIIDQINTKKDEVLKVELAGKNIELKKQELTDLLIDIEQRPPVSLEVNEDRLDLRLGPLYTRLDDLKRDLSASEFADFEGQVLLCDWRETKRAIFERVYSDEMDLKNSDFYYATSSASQSCGWDVIIGGERGYGRLRNLIRRVSQNPSISGLNAEMQRDYDRYTKELGFRRKVFFAEQKLEPLIFGFGNQDDDASRDFPSQVPEIFIDMDSFPTAINPSGALSADERIKVENELVYNRQLSARADTIRDFAHPDHFVDIPDFTPTAHGEAMRLIDLLYANKLHTRITRAIAAAGRTPSPDEAKLIAEVNGYYRTIHVGKNKNAIPEIINQASKIICQHEILPYEVRQAWLFHAMLLNQSMLIPASSPRTNDQIYKANQWAEYVVAGTEGGTTPASIFESVCLFRLQDVREAGGKRFVLENVGRYNTSDLTPSRNFTQWVAHKLTPLPDAGNTRSTREKILENLDHQGVVGFDFLADLPLVILPESDFGTHQVIPLPLQYMIFNDPTSPLPPLRAGETRVRRWPIGTITNPSGTVETTQPPPVTAADYVNSDGDIMYELIPWSDVLRDTGIENLYNNGKNIKKLYKLISSGPIESSLNPADLAGEQNDVKYAASFFPVWGQEVSCGRYDSAKVWRRITVAHVFSRALTLLTIDKKSLSEVKTTISYLSTAIGADSVRAIDIALDAAFGNMENAQETTQLVMDQIVAKLTIQK